MAGSPNVTAGNNSFRVLFELNRVKKLLYLKHDPATDSLYVSTLNYVYECALSAEESVGEGCRIIARNLVSARGLYLDNANRLLYVVDHKKRKINRIKLKNGVVKKDVNSHIERADEDEPEIEQEEEATDSLKAATTLIGDDTMPDMGDVFYMCIYNRTGANLLIWSEFSGKYEIFKLCKKKMEKINISK